MVIKVRYWDGIEDLTRYCKVAHFMGNVFRFCIYDIDDEGHEYFIYYGEDSTKALEHMEATGNLDFDQADYLRRVGK